MYSGKDVLVVYDDLSKHAVGLQEHVSPAPRPSGREAYPATSSICTAAFGALGKAQRRKRGGSITALADR
jgi:F-type H+-transporting ATPase subunit alpha